MDDHTALERQIGQVLGRMGGPEPAFDALSIVRTAGASTSPTWRFQSLLSATKFVLAGVVVALFAGFLVAGALTQPSELAAPAGDPASASPSAAATADVRPAPEAMTRTDLLPGVALVAEEVEPGTWRVVDDGVRDLSRPVDLWDPLVFESNIVAGQDGSVWVFGPDEYYRLGDGRAHLASPEAPSSPRHKAMATPDGALWAITEDTSSLVSFTEGTWTVQKAGVMAFDVQPDGTVWAVATDGTLLRRDAGEWVEAGDVSGLGDRVRDLWVSPVIHEFFAQSYGSSDADVEVLLLTDGGVGAVGGSDLSVGFPRLAGGGFGPAGALEIRLGSLVDMDVHGDYWIYQNAQVPIAGQGLADSGAPYGLVPYLVRVTGGPTMVYSEEEGAPLVGSDVYGWPDLRAAADGSVWLTPGTEDPESETCEGMARFDGTTLERHLTGVCIYAFDIAPDGSIWVRASGPPTGTGVGQMDTYVITPDAVAATE